MFEAFFTTPAGASLLALAFGVAAGLIAGERSVASRVALVLVAAAFTATALTLAPQSVWVGLTFVFATVVTALVRDLRRYADSPLLAGEPPWRRVFLVATHGARVRRAFELSREAGA